MTKDIVETDEATEEETDSPQALSDEAFFGPSRLAVPELFPKSLSDRIQEAFGRTFEGMVAPLSLAIKGLTASIQQCKKIEACGWLPHYTMPFAMIRDDMTANEISAVIEQHYRENWDGTERAFLERLEAYQIDDEAKATFKEALACHKYGLYRAVPRTLFPEIERVACVELYEGSRIYRKENDKSPKTGITSLPYFAEKAGKLPVRDVYSYRFCLKLREHLYKTVKSPDEIAKAAADAVPNRHAALHGIVTYSTMKNSMNALIMTDFIFYLICQIKMLSKETASKSS